MVAIKIVKIRTRYQATVWSGLNLRETFQWNIDTNTSWWHQKAMINGVSSYLSSVTLLLTGPIMTCDTWRATFQSWSKHQLSLGPACWAATGGINQDVVTSPSGDINLPTHQTWERGVTTDQVQQVWGWWQHSLPSCGHSDVCCDDCWGINI